MGEYTYCLDANVLIEGWNKYYSFELCPSYWEILNKLGELNIIYLPEEVKEEIIRKDDLLSAWLKKSSIPIARTDDTVVNCWKQILQADQRHKFLVDNTKGRSLADPWIIAHALNRKSIVVTKENKVTVPNSNNIKIPNVCENVGLRWIDDFQFLRQVNIVFTCQINSAK